MRRFPFLMIFLAALLPAGLGNAQGSSGYRVVVHPDSPARTLSQTQVSRYFLKKVTKWDDGTKVKPVDLPRDSAVRARFSEEVHGRSVSAIKSYWQQKIFSGRAVPPPEKATDAGVIAFAKEDRGAIGYVSSSTNLSGVRVLEVTQ